MATGVAPQNPVQTSPKPPEPRREPTVRSVQRTASSVLEAPVVETSWTSLCSEEFAGEAEAMMVPSRGPASGEAVAVGPGRGSCLVRDAENVTDVSCCRPTRCALSRAMVSDAPRDETEASSSVEEIMRRENEHESEASSEADDAGDDDAGGEADNGDAGDANEVAVDDTTLWAVAASGETRTWSAGGPISPRAECDMASLWGDAMRRGRTGGDSSGLEGGDVDSNEGVDEECVQGLAPLLAHGPSSHR